MIARMKRQLMSKIATWAQSERRKPLLLLGARQVGKTTLLKTFGAQHFEQMLYINFDDQPRLKAIFDPDLQPARIIRDLNLAMDINIAPDNTFIFFDEIQECPNALNSLKYFQENANEYTVAGAGSLLGVKLAHLKGFPVGKVHFETLHPLHFSEYLHALGEEALAEYIQTITLTESINPAIHHKLIDYLKKYLVTGGMPEAVDEFRATHDFEATREIQRDILRAYDLDFIKHAPKEDVMRITECFYSLPSQLGKENKKFIYSKIRPDARARSHENALQWLIEAGLFYKVINTSTVKLPLSAYENRQIFKTYLLDVGLLNTMAELSPKIILENDRLFQEFAGALTENFVMQSLRASHHQLHYWTSRSQAEVDLIVQSGNTILPIEIKTGHSNRKKSLQVYREKFKPPLAIRTSPQNLDTHDSFINLPLYLIEQLDRLIDRY